MPAGTFDAYKVELTSDGGPYQRTVWIAKDSHTPVKAYAVQVYPRGTTFSTTELVP